MKLTKMLATICMTYLLAASPAIPGTQSAAQAEKQFESARHLEVVDGDLKAAIEQYGKIIATRGVSREIVAKALLRLGGCYEKLGQADARKVYERLVQELADQTEQANAARAELAALDDSGSKAARSAMAVRRIWSGRDVDVSGSVSRDGKYLTFVDTDTEDLDVRDLETGRNRRLTSIGKDSGSFAYGSRWAPDGKEIVYDWYDGVSKNGWSKSGLRIMNLKTSVSRPLYNSSEGMEVNTYDWSPDGKFVLASVMDSKRSSNMVLISVADGSVRTLKAQEWGNARFSPDSRYIAYGRPAIGEPSDIFLFSLIDGHDTPLVENPADDFILEWSPDGNWILFASDRSGTFGIWAIQVISGKARGMPQLIKSDIPRIIPMGMTRNGSLYFGYAPLVTNVYVARLDPDTGKVSGQPELAAQRFAGISASPSYSLDGRYLAYACANGPMSGMASPSQNILRVRSLETGAEREFKTELYGIDTPRWSPDANTVLLAGHHNSRVDKVALQTGQITTIIRNTPGVIVRDHDITVDGKAFYYVRLEMLKGICQILLRNLEDGTEKELYRSPGNEQFRIARSPDGRWLAFLNRSVNRVLRIMPADGGEPREIFRFEQKGNFLIPISWTADGKYILLSRPDSDFNWALWRVPVNGGTPEKMSVEKRCESVTTHPNGRLLAFSLTEDTTNEVWVMDNFLQNLKPAK